MNRRRLSQAVAGAALVAFTALGATGAQADIQRTAPAPQAPAARAARTIERADVRAALDQDTYLTAIRGLLAGKPGAAQSDADLIASGKSICVDIDAGATSATFEQQIVDYQLDRAVYRTVIRVSILTYCPEDSAQIIR